MGSVRRRKNKEYYAVISGRIDEPTIFSSWGDAHPRVTGCSATHKAFFTIEEAREYMEMNSIFDYKEIIKETALGTTPERNCMAYYAVAHGANPGVRRVWYGNTGALDEIDEIPGACHKRFRTESQAAAFIKDWKESFADVWRREIKQGLDQGLRPRDMKVSIGALLHEGGVEMLVENLTKRLDERLELAEAEQ